jgi:hypothetical protein
VPSKGLEPPHPCGYMDLNHARLPIPPRWQKYCGYRRPLRATFQERTTNNILQGHRWLSNLAMRARTQALSRKSESYPSSVAVIVIFAFSTFDTGQPLFALSAAF